MHGNARQTELEADHFALLGSPEAPCHRTRRLRKNRRMSRCTTPPDRTATAMEQQ